MAEKAKIVVEGGDTIEVMYNPNEYTISMASEASGDGANITFGKMTLSDFTVNLFFDTYEKQTDVRTETKKVTDLIFPKDPGKNKNKPYVCKFVWGKSIYKGYMIKADQKFTMFLTTGVPVRADVSVTFKSILTASEHAELMGQSNSRKYWTVRSGDRLDLIANAMLSDSSLWRVIAKANGIKDPFTFPSEAWIGKVLMIPNYYHKSGSK